jgi:DNA polymerase I-like protein with 3'-5' exonuclease and polymerase domains
LFAKKFLDFRRAELNYKVLTRMASGVERVYPTFNCFGTVTGRILAVDPPLQELRKRYRCIFAPELGHKFLYLDYGQFEPGILAFLAGDLRLQEQYASTDLYDSLSMAIFGNEDHRAACKKVFLSYCYGMNPDQIAKLLAGTAHTGDQIEEYKQLVLAFFNAFPSLPKYKTKLERDLQEHGYVSSIFGNKRVRSSGGPLTAKERRWCLSQAVQGTASLIFKTALLKLANQFGNESIVLPMHDAVLLQLPVGSTFLSAKKNAIGLMKSAFEQWCPKMNAKVVPSKFGIE